MSSTAATTTGQVRSTQSISATGFASSTHAHHWIWSTTNELDAIRRRAQIKPKERLIKQQKAAAARAPSPNTTTTDPTAVMMTDVESNPTPAPPAATTTTTVATKKEKKEKSDSPVSLEPLTLEEERQLRLHYLLQLSQMATILKLPTHVTHTAITFFQRFFLRQSVMEYAPKDILYCCIYLACKAEEHHLPLERMIHEITKTQQSAKDAATTTATSTTTALPVAIGPSAAVTKTVSTILSLEVPLLTELKFQLRIFHLARPSKGLIKEFEECDPIGLAAGTFINATNPALTQKGAPGTTLQSVAQFLTTRSAVLHEAVLLTDAIFLFTPAQIALACLVQAEKEVKQFGIDAALDTSAPGSVAQTPISSLQITQKFFDMKEKVSSTSISSTTADSPIKLLRTKLASLQTYIDLGLSAPHTMDKKALKSIEKRRKLLTNSALDPFSAEALEAKRVKEAEKEVKRDAKKKKQREEMKRQEEELLMSDAPTTASSAAALDSSPFQISKRAKSNLGTPIRIGQFEDATVNEVTRGMATATTATTESPARANLADQFSDAME